MCGYSVLVRKPILPLDKIVRKPIFVARLLSFLKDVNLKVNSFVFNFVDAHDLKLSV